MLKRSWREKRTNDYVMEKIGRSELLMEKLKKENKIFWTYD